MRHLPNALSALRLTLAYPVVLALRDGHDGAALVFLAVALATDAADGLAARRLDAHTEAGRVLDPLADKVLAAAVAFALFAWRGLPAWFLAVVVGRDLLLLVGGALVARRSGRVPSSRGAGKIAFGALGGALLYWIAGPAAYRTPVLAAGTALLALSLAMYARAHVPGLGAGRGKTT